jgi:hypothetical protein
MAQPRSLQLSLEGLPDEASTDGPFLLRREIFNSFVEAGINEQSIEGIDCMGMMFCYIVFTPDNNKPKLQGKR